MLCDVEKVFAKKPRFLPDKETEFLILDKVELRLLGTQVKIKVLRRIQKSEVRSQKSEVSSYSPLLLCPSASPAAPCPLLLLPSHLSIAHHSTADIF
ncbi:MAG: hypothetical protein V7L23_12030 [Nostoc sp.]|uniref:hypothetical protein n=1 Tax=Nostoc sp. TaxID=1180 RepID=UPI002FF33BA0